MLLPAVALGDPLNPLAGVTGFSYFMNILRQLLPDYVAEIFKVAATIALAHSGVPLRSFGAITRRFA